MAKPAAIKERASAAAEETPLSREDLDAMNAYWRACNYLSVGMIYLQDNPLLEEPLRVEHIKPRLLGHWGTTPGLNLLYVHLNRLIRERAVATMMVVAVLAGTANIVVQVLAPRYVSGVIGVDPADSVYVFAPSALGLGLALLGAPRLIRRFGERVVALAGFVLVGASLGVITALALSRFLGSVLFGVSPTDLTSFTRALLLILGVVVLATLAPAWRAARTNAMRVLRHQ